MTNSYKYVAYVSHDNTMGYKRTHMKSTEFLAHGMEYISDTGFRPSYFDWMAVFANAVGLKPYMHIRNAFNTDLIINELPQILFTCTIMLLVQTFIVLGGILILPAIMRMYFREATCRAIRNDRINLIMRMNLKL